MSKDRMTLYEINQAIEDVIDNGFSVDAETGEILFDASDLEKLEEDKYAKVENIALYYKNEIAIGKSLKEEEENIAKRRKRAEKRAEWLSQYLQAMLQGEKYESTKCVISYRKSETLDVKDMTKVPTEFLKYAEPTVDKMGLKKAIKSGLEVEGVSIIEKQNMSIK